MPLKIYLNHANRLDPTSYRAISYMSECFESEAIGDRMHGPTKSTIWLGDPRRTRALTQEEVAYLCSYWWRGQVSPYGSYGPSWLLQGSQRPLGP